MMRRHHESESMGRGGEGGGITTTTKATTTSTRNSSAGGKSAGGGPSIIFLTVGLLLLFVITTITFQSPNLDKYTVSTFSSSSPSSSATPELSMTKWRSMATAQCKSLLTTIATNSGAVDDLHVLKQKEALEESLLAMMTISKPKKNTPIYRSHENAVPVYNQDCRNVFIDLGTNIGDSIGHFIDTVIDVCSPLWWEIDPKLKFNTTFPRLHLDVSTLEFHQQNVPTNRLLFLLQRLLKGQAIIDGQNKSLQESSSSFLSQHQPSSYDSTGVDVGVGPESFCIYGVEGNPTFTDRLIKLQNFIMDSIQPRPISHIHIFTESVAVATDGPTQLYLDKTSTENNVSIDCTGDYRILVLSPDTP
jgi:hypothetical protein